MMGQFIYIEDCEIVKFSTSESCGWPDIKYIEGWYSQIFANSETQMGEMGKEGLRQMNSSDIIEWQAYTFIYHVLIVNLLDLVIVQLGKSGCMINHYQLAKCLIIFLLLSIMNENQIDSISTAAETACSKINILLLEYHKIWVDGTSLLRLVACNGIPDILLIHLKPKTNKTMSLCRKIFELYLIPQHLKIYIFLKDSKMAATLDTIMLVIIS